MSTVALRGKLEYDESSKEWKWEGLWAFGNSLAEAEASSSSTAQQPNPDRGDQV